MNKLTIDLHTHKFMDGTQRFIGWGGVLGSWFLTAKQADVATGIAQAAGNGFNCMRLHHLDSFNYPNIYTFKGGDADSLKRTYRTNVLDPQYMQCLDWAIYQCGLNGIRVMLDLWNHRQLTGADLAAWPQFQPLFDDAVYPTQKGEIASFFFLMPEARQLVIDGANLLLNHVNQYTGLAYKDDPIISWFMLANEKDVVTHSQQFVIGQTPHNTYSTLYLNALQSFFTKWNITKPHKSDYEKFKADLEYQAFSQYKAALTGIKGRPIITHSYWGNSQWSSLASISACSDVADLHCYSRQKITDANCMSQTFDNAGNPSFQDVVASVHMQYKPLTISEWAPVRQSDATRETEADCIDSFQTVAQYCINQDVDAAFLFMYNQGDPIKATNNAYNFAMDAQLMALFKQLAPQVVNPSRTTFRLSGGTLPPYLIVGEEIPSAQGGFVNPSAWNQQWVRTIAATKNAPTNVMPQGQIPELPWLK